MNGLLTGFEWPFKGLTEAFTIAFTCHFGMLSKELPKVFLKVFAAFRNVKASCYQVSAVQGTSSYEGVAKSKGGPQGASGKPKEMSWKGPLGGIGDSVVFQVPWVPGRIKV